MSTAVRQSFPSFNPQALRDTPSNLFEGVAWSGFVALSAYYAAGSLQDLYALTSNAAATVEKVARTVKAVFVDLVSILCSAVYVVRWADTSKVIALGEYLPLINYLCFGTSGVIHAVESASQLYDIQRHIQGILTPQPREEVEQHKRWLFHDLVKLASHVTMVVWAALGVAGVATGYAMTPLISGAILLAALALGVGAFCYKSNYCQVPNTNG
jgi:hypothetical protein